MKVVFYKFKPDNLSINYKYLDKLTELVKLKEVKWIFLYEKNINDLINSISEVLKFFPESNFIPILESENLKAIPKIMAIGAYSFVMPPFEKNIEKTIDYIKEDFQKKQEQASIKKIFQNIVGVSREMKEIFELISKVAPSDSTVLVMGESGTGKELVARAIYKLSNRKNAPFVAVNCGAIPENLLESELFGYVKGAFTGAVNKKIGRFEAANNGTIFLDEISEMPLPLQVKLLRVIQEREIQPIGSNNTIKVNIRIIAATNKNLEQLVQDGKFREDLYYRLNVIPIGIPPLRDRKEDIEELCRYFFKKFVKEFDKIDQLKGFADETLWILKNYNWPGNVRELENTIERIVVLKDDGYILPSDLPDKFFQSDEVFNDNQDVSEISDREYLNSIIQLKDEGINLKETIEQIETSLILQALERAGGVKDKAAKLLQMKRTTLIEKLKRKNLM